MLQCWRDPLLGRPGSDLRLLVLPVVGGEGVLSQRDTLMRVLQRSTVSFTCGGRGGGSKPERYIDESLTEIDC